MTYIKNTVLVYLFLMCILPMVSGCSGKLPNQIRHPSFTPSQQPILKLTETLVPSLVPTETATHTSIPTVTPTPSLTVTPTLLPTITLTPLPTLNPTQVLDVLQKYLSEGMECESPCFISVVPGKTTLDQAFSIFDWLGSPLWHAPDPVIYSTDLGYKDGLAMLATLGIENNIVKNMEIRISLGNYKGPVNPRVWRAFSQDALLAKYGHPTQVGFNVSFLGPSEYTHYDLIMDFESIDLAVYYTGGIVKDGHILTICPLTDQYTGVWIYFGKDPENQSGFDFSLPLEKASSLTIDQFSELMTQTSRSACFDISKDAFLTKP